MSNDPDTPPTLPPGCYRLRPESGRWWSADELEVVRLDGVWYVVPRVALARLPEPAQETDDADR